MLNTAPKLERRGQGVDQADAILFGLRDPQDTPAAHTLSMDSSTHVIQLYKSLEQNCTARGPRPVYTYVAYTSHTQIIIMPIPSACRESDACLPHIGKCLQAIRIGPGRHNIRVVPHNSDV